VSDYETAQRKRNITVGIFVIVGICALVWLIVKFGELPTTVRKLGSFEIFVRFPKADGVQKGTPVQFCGYQIGSVTKVMAPRPLENLFTHRKYHQTQVILSINKRFANIPSNVDVKLIKRGLGSSYIQLKVEPEKLPPPPKDPNRPETKFLHDKMVMQGTTGIASEFFPAETQQKLDQLVGSLNTLVGSANQVLGDKKNQKNIRNTLANLSEATSQAKKSLEEFERFSSAGADTLQKADKKLNQITVAMVDTTGNLNKVLTESRLILSKINQGQGTMGKMFNDGRLYENLLENTEQIKLLIEELKNFMARAREKGLPIKVK